mmetsp:Transcript_73182/g.152827  ORF Transcript_73182/g.152827 Transcript_73182/m.152827 type:complete len:214 (-) Transcript_73182:571-1212(-)
MEAIGRSTIAIGIKSKDGIVLATEKKETKNGDDEDIYSNKIFLIDSHILCAVSGIIPDSQILIEHARIEAHQHKKMYQDPIPIKKILGILCDIKQQFTHRGGQRPFGISLLVAGWDSSHGLQLFRTDPSGTFSGWNAIAIGSHSITNQSILTDEFYPEIDLNQALGILVKILYKKTTVSELWNIIDIVVLAKDDKQNILIHRMEKQEINSLII